MVGLKRKLPASTLMETMVSTVLLVVIFMVSSMILNNLFQNQLDVQKEQVQHRLEVLAYQYRHNELANTYTEELGDWQIRLDPAGSVPQLIAQSTKNEEQITIELQ